MLDKVLNTHLDSMAEIEKLIKEDIDTLISAIDIDELINDPENTLIKTVGDIREVIITEYMPQAKKNGEMLASNIKHEDITIDPSKESTKNNDDSNNKE